MAIHINDATPGFTDLKIEKNFNSKLKQKSPKSNRKYLLSKNSSIESRR